MNLVCRVPIVLHLVMIWDASKFSVIFHLWDKVTNFAEIVLGSPWVLGVTGYDSCVICSIGYPAFLAQLFKKFHL